MFIVADLVSLSNLRLIFHWNHLFVVVFYALRQPSQQFFIHVDTIPRLPGLNNAADKLPCSRKLVHVQIEGLIRSCLCLLGKRIYMRRSRKFRQRGP